MDRRHVISTAWITTTLTLPAELFVGSRVTGKYDWIEQTISELGVTQCLTTCSPAHALLNTAMVISGISLIFGALWITRQIPHEWQRWAIGLSLSLVGLSTAATGLVPLNVDAELHVLVSIPALALAPCPVLLLAPCLLREQPWANRGVLTLATIGLIAGVTVAIWLDAPWSGLLERLAVWPSTLLIAAAGITVALKVAPQATCHPPHPRPTT